MARLEELVESSIVLGIIPHEPVTVVSTRWYGTACLSVFYRTDRGQTGERVLYREDEPSLEIVSRSLPWSFTAGGDKLRLVSEAYRIHLAYLFDPYLAVHTSAIDPLPHQISAVYQEMLHKLPLRYVLADDPGAGKTIMTGLLIKELIIRGDLKRCLIVAPGNLCEQWQDELYGKFHLRFELLTNDRMESAVSGNVFTEINYAIARLDKLARDDDLQEKLKISEWDLIVCDEAHKMSATFWGGEAKYTKRFLLGRLLSGITRHFLLLTATPHNGKEEDFQLFMSLIDQDRFEGALRTSNQSIDVNDVMRRLVKEDLLKFDGTPLFPERIAYTVNYDLSDAEARLYAAVTTYVQEEFNRADHLDGQQRSTVGFALTILQRRLASSPEAILPIAATYKSNSPTDRAILTAGDILQNRGLSPRIYRNMLAFVAPDQNMMPSLKDAARQFLAWKSIKEDSQDLNLDAAQNRETQNMLERCERTIEDRIKETYCWLLVPYIDLELSKSEIVWEVSSIRGGTDTIVAKAARKMEQTESLISTWAPALLLMELDKHLWGDGDSKNIGDLWKQLCQYCYLPRLTCYDVLANAIQNGVNSDEYFAYADSVTDGRFNGLKYNRLVPLVDKSGYIVKQMAALKQLAQQQQTPTPQPVVPVEPGTPGGLHTQPGGFVVSPDGQGGQTPIAPPPQPVNKHFYLTTGIDTIHVLKDISRLMDEVVNHLSQVDGAAVRIRFEVDADLPNGAPVPTVRTVTENCRTLHVEDFGFDR